MRRKEQQTRREERVECDSWESEEVAIEDCFLFQLFRVINTAESYLSTVHLSTVYLSTVSLLRPSLFFAVKY